MKCMKNAILAVCLLIAATAFAQQPSAMPSASDSPTSRHVTTVRGCLNGERGNYILVEDDTGMIYALKGVGNKLDSYLNHDVEVKGKMLPGVIKSGVRPEKAGSNPSDTVHGVDGVPLQVYDVRNDIRLLSKHCKAADAE